MSAATNRIAVLAFLVSTGLAVTACGSKIAYDGIEADRVEEIEIGTKRSTVEKFVDATEGEQACAHGSIAYYSYDRGRPAAELATGAAVTWGAMSAMTFGLPELHAMCWIECQTGLLKVYYDDADRVVSTKHLPRSYDVGFYCGRDGLDSPPLGDVVPLRPYKAGSHCRAAQGLAFETDRGKTIEASSPEEFEALGCES